jgi:hypothetical protein
MVEPEEMATATKRRPAANYQTQNRETVKYDHESCETGTKNDCAGEGQQQFNCTENITKREELV